MKSALTLVIPILALATFVAAAPEAAPAPAPFWEHQLLRRGKKIKFGSGSRGGYEEEGGYCKHNICPDFRHNADIGGLATNSGGYSGGGNSSDLVSSAITTRPWLVGAGVAVVAVGGVVELW